VPRIVWGDDHASLLGAVRALLEEKFELLAAVEDGEAALEAVRTLSPDAAVLDITMPGLSGIEVARMLRDLESGPAVVFLTMHRDPEIVSAALATGALGYVLKCSAGRELVPAIEEALAGRRFVSPSLRDGPPS
jgi:DNA-binding NarL/FixJ family response regulator